MNGIDVSEHQGDFDFTPYKDGFVIIRGGYGIRNVDKWAERNIAKCDALGIPWGIFWYSYALNGHTAKLEAERCLRFLNGRKPRLGVWFDMEDADGEDLFSKKLADVAGDWLRARLTRRLPRCARPSAQPWKRPGTGPVCTRISTGLKTESGTRGMTNGSRRGAGTTGSIIPIFPGNASFTSTAGSRLTLISCTSRFRILTMARRAEQSPAPTKRKE